MRDQAKIDAAQVKIDAARAELETANKRFHAIYARQKKVIEAEAAKDVITLESALTVYVADRIENSAGYDWLNDRCWKGEWKGLGIMQSGYFPATNQYALKLALKRIATDEELDKLSAVLENEVIPVLKPGALVDPEKRSFRHKQFDQFADAKVIEIMAADLSEHADFKLLIRADGTAEVWNMRDLSYRTESFPIGKGSVRSALTVIRNNCYWEID